MFKLFVFAAILAFAFAAPEPKADPQFAYLSGISPTIYSTPYTYNSGYYGGYSPYAAGYYGAYGSYNTPYAYRGLYY